MATYSRGDHLRVGRLPIAGRFLYYHHGIYIGDDRVVQFGGQLWNKPRSGIDQVPLERFSKRGMPEILGHTNLRFPGGMPLPPAYPPERIVARARCLVETQPRGVYNLIGRNCETIALWCVCGSGGGNHSGGSVMRMRARTALDALFRRDLCVGSPSRRARF